MEETLVIIKPDGMKNIDNILNILYKNNLKIKNYKLMKLDKDILHEHYSHIINESYYPEIEKHMTSGYVAVMIVEGINAIEKIRIIIGNTDSKIATKGTIRNMYGTDKTRNAIHASDSKENAIIEIDRFFQSNNKVLKLTNK